MIPKCCGGNMAEKIGLGGGIELVDFSGIEPGKQVIARKMVGSYARQLSEKDKSYEKLCVVLINSAEAEAAKSYSLKAELTLGGKTLSAEASSSNLFVALDEAMKNLVSQIA